MSGSIETIPTQPRRRSPKCTLPSRPRGDARLRGPCTGRGSAPGATPRIDVRGEVAVQDAQPVLGRHRERRAGGDRLLAVAVVERAGHLALAVEGHRALLEPAHQQHRAQQPMRSSSVRCSTLRRPAGGRLRRMGRHLCLPFRPWARSGSPSGPAFSGRSRDLRSAPPMGHAPSLPQRPRASTHERAPGLPLANGGCLAAPVALASARRLDVARVRGRDRSPTVDRASAAAVGRDPDG